MKKNSLNSIVFALLAVSFLFYILSFQKCVQKKICCLNKFSYLFFMSSIVTLLLCGIGFHSTFLKIAIYVVHLPIISNVGHVITYIIFFIIPTPFQTTISYLKVSHPT